MRGQVRGTRHRAAVEDDAIAMLEWESGATGMLVASLADPAGYERLELFGDRGAVRLEDGYDLRVTEHDDAQRLSDDCPRRVPGAHARVAQRRDRARPRSEWLDCLVDAHRDFAGAVLDGRAPLVDGEEGTRAVELANAIYLSSLEDAVVELPLERGEYTSVVRGARGRKPDDLTRRRGGPAVRRAVSTSGSLHLHD